MDQQTLQRRRALRARERRRRRLTRLAALGALAVVLAATGAAIALGSGGSGSGGGGRPAASADAGRRAQPRSGARRANPAATHAELGPPTGHPGDARVPILMYHVINPPFPDSPYPGLYVPRAEFAAQMQALRGAGWHAVTLDEVRQNWLRGDRLPARPFVITFDNGYRSQYTNALPILRRLHWTADENLQLTGLPPDQGGLTAGQVRGLIRAGWELDTQGVSHADLVELDGAELRAQVAGARRTLRRRYGVPVNWFCYPSGQYDPTVVAAVRAAGFVGSTTVIPGWGERGESPYALPRLRVLGGTSPAALLTQIADARGAPAPPSSDTSSSA
jgi:peptidoglycan/xylan/chitin deacetylase (PgdA/CDA1 family)